MSEQIIWLMDSDFCDVCGELLAISITDGQCFTCSEHYLAETSEDDWYEGQDEEWTDDARDINALPVKVVVDHPYFQEKSTLPGVIDVDE